MKKIVYGAAGVVTSDAIADAVMQYARALALGVKADLVDIPVRMESGAQDRAQILLGPASQLVSVPAEDGDGELDDADVLEELMTKTRRLGGSRPVAYSPNDFDDTDYSQQ
ncbi:MAG: hypothetical protein ABWX59_10510 [Microbacteriaceae bacterium]